MQGCKRLDSYSSHLTRFSAPPASPLSGEKPTWAYFQEEKNITNNQTTNKQNQKFWKILSDAKSNCPTFYNLANNITTLLKKWKKYLKKKRYIISCTILQRNCKEYYTIKNNKQSNNNKKQNKKLTEQTMLQFSWKKLKRI